MGIITKALGAAATTALLASPANAGCWTDAAYQAAQVRELDTMLMVQALRCRKTAATFLNEYNNFVQISRPTLLRANAELKAHFGGLNAYDNYMTTVANRYGAGTGDLDCDDTASIVRAAVATRGSSDALYRLAADARMEPAIDGARCGGGPKSTLTIASNR